MGCVYVLCAFVFGGRREKGRSGRGVITPPGVTAHVGSASEKKAGVQGHTKQHKIIRCCKRRWDLGDLQVTSSP